MNINGQKVDASKDPWAAFQALAGEGRETRDERRATRQVQEATGNRVGYVYVPDTGRGGQGWRATRDEWRADSGPLH